MSTFTTNSPIYKNEDELAQAIMVQVSRQVKKYTHQHSVDVDEMSSNLISKVFFEVKDRPHLWNKAGVNNCIKFRSMDFFREMNKDKIEIEVPNELTEEHELIKKKVSNVPFSTLSHEDTDSFVEFPIESDFDLAENYVYSSEMNSFLDSLPLIERQIVELSSGITSSLDQDHLHKVHELIKKKAHKTKDPKVELNIWFTATEIGEILGLTRRQVQHPLTKMKEKALDFGLWH